MNKQHEKTVSSSSAQTTKSVKQVSSDFNEHELVNSPEHKSKNTGQIAKGYSTTSYANEQQVDNFIRSHQLYCFFTRKQIEHDKK